MSSPQKVRAAAFYTTRVDKTLKILQQRVKEQEALLEEVSTHLMHYNTSKNTLSFELPQFQLQLPSRMTANIIYTSYGL